MDETQAFTVVSALANGVNPLTGEMFGSESPYQSAEIVRALFYVLRVAQTKSKAEVRRTNLPRNAGKPWGDEEDRALLARFDSGKPVEELARLHERTTAGIAARLERHGRLQPEPGNSAARYPQPREPNNKPRQNGR